MTKAEDELRDWRWLISEPGKQLLGQLKRLDSEPLQMQKWLRKQEVSPEQSRLVMEQWTLADKAKSKLGLSSTEYPFERGVFVESTLLQQSTGAALANWKAKKFEQASSVVDICCGLGGDLLALARANLNRRCLGVDRSELACFLSQLNCESLGAPAEIECASAEDVVFDSKAWFHLDPDRRVEGQRSTNLTQFSPAPEILNRIVDAQQNGAIKLAPATHVPLDWQERCEQQWLGDAHECKQLVVWFGETSEHKDTRSAAAVADDGTLIFEWRERNVDDCEPALAWDEYLYEPHSTLIAGKLVDSLAADLCLKKASKDVAYLTGPRIDFEGVTRFEVIESIRMDEQRVAEAMLALGCESFEVKKRGLEHQFVKQFESAVKSRLRKLNKKRANTIGPQPNGIVLFLTRLATSYSAVITQRS